jgi:hypothetical protein
VQHQWRPGEYARTETNVTKRDTMTELATVLSALRRPKILIRAARAGVVDYRRERDLKRLLKGRAGAPSQAIVPLLAEEHRLEAHRIAGEATYSIQRHVAVLTAIIAEARLLPAVSMPALSAMPAAAVAAAA